MITIHNFNKIKGKTFITQKPYNIWQVTYAGETPDYVGQVNNIYLIKIQSQNNNTFIHNIFIDRVKKGTQIYNPITFAAESKEYYEVTVSWNTNTYKMHKSIIKNFDAVKLYMDELVETID
jgi:hypothetical protein